jgi:integrase
LRVDDIDLTAKSISIRGTKNKSAKRLCPIHADLLPVLKRMVDAVGTGPLFPGVTRIALTHAFLRLKSLVKTADDKQAFGELYDFHSVRRTVIDMFRNAGAREEIVAAFVGHKVKTITYGLYAGAPPLSVMAETMTLLKYP